MWKPRLTVLVGMIASGKTYYCKQAAHSGDIIINDDEVVKLVHGGDYLLYDEKKKKLYKAIETQAICTALAMGYNCVIDRGVNISMKSRRRWVGIAHAFDCICEAILFEPGTAEQHARHRTNCDARGHDYEYWLKVAYSHLDRWQPPRHSEGFDSIVKMPCIVKDVK